MTINAVTSTGLVTQELPEIVTDLDTSFKSIYGADIDLSQNTPDGQLIGIIAQAKKDILDVITDVYNSFDPDAAEGIVLDQRVAINGISRIGGTYSITPVSITVDRALILQGLDGTGTPFTVTDGAGNNFLLEETQIIAAAGTNSYNFRSEKIGAIQITANTITTQVTVTIGVTAVNNPDPAGVIGIDEESDSDLKIRRQVSIASSSSNSTEKVRIAIADVASVSDSYVSENTTSGTVGTIPSHTIWAIVEGGANADIAQAIYKNRSAGCGMKGGVTEPELTPDGSYFDILFDRPTYVPLHIKFTLTARGSGTTYVAADVKQAIVDQLKYKINQTATSEDIWNILLTIVPLYIPTVVQISTNGTNWYEIIASSAADHKFTLSVANIAIT